MKIMDKFPVILLLILFVVVIAIAGCSLFGRKKEIKPFVSDVVHPPWSKNVVLYEVNIRQYTGKGTFKAFEGHLQRLSDLGIGVLWFMPIYPIGILNRKGELGSYYSVKDYMDVNPEFGTIEDFTEVVKKAHELGMHVLLDWVPNHTSWDNKLTIDHPEWFVRDTTGRFTPPIGTDWTDVIQLDWTRKGLWDYMINALKFWVNLGVDGFRVDHPDNTPKEFWELARSELEKIKPVLMLAEHESPDLFLEKGFDMNYSWELYHLIVSVAQGKKNARAVTKYFIREEQEYPNNVYRMMFLTNHDENSWAGTIDSLMDGAQKPLATLIFTAQGVPLLYNGQEDCLNRRLKFFEKDSITWERCDLTGFYENLIKLKKENKALWNGNFGGPMLLIRTNRNRKVFSFCRENEGNRVITFLNLNSKKVTFRPDIRQFEGDYRDYFSGENISLDAKQKLTLGPWAYKVMIKVMQ
jgi:1,4-alpha-glucan branching enzyme